MGDNSIAKIRTATPKDFDEIYNLLKQLWPVKKLNKNGLITVFSRGIGSQTDEYLCVEINDKVIGFCSLAIKNSLWQEGSIGYICEIVVELPFRNQGIGTTLLKSAIEAAKKKGCRRIELDSAFHREKAHRFYEKLGFEKRGYLFSRVI